MQRITAGRLRAIGESIRTVDLASAAALVSGAEWVQAVEHALREANIQLAAPGLQTATVVALRDQIDALLEVVARPQPISQEDGS